MSFGEPVWLLALILLPVVAGLYFFRQRQSERLISKIVSPRLREQLAGQVSIPLRLLRAVLMLSVLGMVIVALAKPRNGFEEQKIQAKGRDVLIAVDVSRSMLATDFPPTRLMRAKLFAQDLLRLLPGDRVGVIAFAGSAFLQAPLTLDSSAVLATLEELDPDVIPKGGTNIAAAIDIALQAFGKDSGASRALVIVSDGEELDANGVAAAGNAAKSGVRIFTVGVGSREGSLIPIRGAHGKSDFVRDSEGNPVLSKLDVSRMEEIAEATGGFYTPLTPQSAETIYQQGILPMKETLADMKEGLQPIEIYRWPVGAAIVALVLWLLIGERRGVRRREEGRKGRREEDPLTLKLRRIRKRRRGEEATKSI